MLADKVQRQMELEHESVTIGIENYRKALRENGVSDTTPGQILLKEGMIPLIRALKEFKLSSKAGSNTATARNLLKRMLCSDEEVAFIALRSLFNELEKDAYLQDVCDKLGRKLVDHHEYLKFKGEMPKYVKAVAEDIKTRDARYKRTVLLMMKRKKGIVDDVFDAGDIITLGQKVIDLLISSTGYVEKELRGDKYIITASALTESWLKKHHQKCELMNPYYMPMIIPPVPWTDHTTGGYLSLNYNAIKTRNRKVVTANPLHENVMRAVNSIQNTAYKINREVLAVLDEVWSSGGCLGKLPPCEALPVPNKPWTTDEEFKLLKATDPLVVKQWKWDASKVHDKNFRLNSKRKSLATKLSLAKQFKDEEEIYFPHSMDWRGRIYPIPSHINPQSDEVGKALLLFAKGIKLGAEGMYWLRVHGANCYGIDKVSFEDRIQWVKDNEAAILDTAVNPLDGGRFWADADDPYMFLAFCFEYSQALKDPENFISHIPVGMDGTCSGIGHFSAMLRDEVGGRQVGLVPTDTPPDIYRTVAGVVSKMVEKDAQDGNENALLWLGKIDRGIAKRNVMTLPYGAKKFGFRGQLEQELSKREEDTGTQYLDTDDSFAPANYLAGRMYVGIGQVVIAARDAMDWLQVTARIAAKAGKPITWSTPVGFKPFQQYFKLSTKRIDTFWGGVRVRLTLCEETDKLDSVKQANGISPNFVHSMDASHLMLSVNKCVENGIEDFAMIHDSFGTHAANVGRLSTLLREAFVEQYSTDVLETFRNEILSQIPEELHKDIPPVPAKGTLDLNKVKESRYFFA